MLDFKHTRHRPIGDGELVAFLLALCDGGVDAGVQGTIALAYLAEDPVAIVVGIERGFQTAIVPLGLAHLPGGGVIRPGFVGVHPLKFDASVFDL